MESKWVIRFEDLVYLIISAGLFCLIITWMLSVLLVSKKSYDYELLNTPSKSLTPEYIKWKWVEGLHDGSSEVIYVPTETNLPILEARDK